MPVRGLALFIVIVPTSIGLGMALASWVVPLLLALFHEGPGGRQIPTQWLIVAHAPAWVDPVRDSLLYGIVELCSGALALPALVVFGAAGLRLWAFLGVRILRWFTEDDVERFNSRRPIL